jgi:fumarate hydratase class II
VATPLNGFLGYEQAAAVVKQAVATGASIADTVRAMGFVERGEISDDELAAALDVDRMTGW